MYISNNILWEPLSIPLKCHFPERPLEVHLNFTRCVSCMSSSEFQWVQSPKGDCTHPQQAPTNSNRVPNPLVAVGCCHLHVK